tara:strand:- start:710 stop:916 length:207 start_codon:yes stop_codon:yes gene_type:complete
MNSRQTPLITQYRHPLDYCSAAIDFLDDAAIDTEDYKTLYCDIIATTPHRRNWKKLTSQLENRLEKLL